MPPAKLPKRAHAGASKPNAPKRRRGEFIKAWLRSPLKMGAFLPSSRGLARAMAAAVRIKNPGVIVELGAGTGVVTHALLDHGVPTDRLIVIERDEGLFAVLAHQMPHINILQADAMQLGKVLSAMEAPVVSAVVSSLPFLTMPKPVRDAIQEQMAEVIGTEGIIVQFTYGTRSPIPVAAMRRLRLTGKRVKIVLTNVPPAHIWVYRRDRRKKAR